VNAELRPIDRVWLDIVRQLPLTFATQRVTHCRHITLPPGMPRAEEFHVLVHEFAQLQLHFSPRRADTIKYIRETEAEAVAFVVGHAIGLNTNSASSDYVAMYDGDNKETLTLSLDHIQQVSTKIFSGITPP
jgi:hypothetical protein